VISYKKTFISLSTHLVFSFIIFLVLFCFYFYHRKYGCMFCMLLFDFVNYVFLLLRLCILIFMYVLFCIFCFLFSIFCFQFCTFCFSSIYSVFRSVYYVFCSVYSLSCSVYSVSTVPTGTLRLPSLRLFRAFPSAVKQMPGYNWQRRGTASTLPN